MSSFAIHLAQESKANSVSICYTGQNEWYVVEEGAQQIKVDIASKTVVTHWLIIVYADGHEKLWVIPVFKDAVSTNTFRKLRVALKVSGK